MKIIDERKPKKKFEELNCGDVFMLNGYTIMKTDVKDKQSNIHGINLQTGAWVLIGENEMCEPLDAELIIRG